ncbi:response regulator [Gramella sp. AN32]|uniref:histidine kinase n=1 Tax=Christiangramia antarctica TaxID=2058158 RepID=A0ABW5X6S9_9FLAO|nr:response regulator [Gramella sp. AN32]
MAQNSKPVSNDSLKNLYTSIDDDLSGLRYQQVVQKSHDLINLAKAAENNYYIAYGYILLGHAYIDQRDSTRARQNYEVGLDYALRTENKPEILIASYNNLGNIYSEIPETRQKGINFYNKAYEIGKQIEEPSEMLVPKSNIAWTYIDMERYELARKHILESLELAKKVTDENGDPFFNPYIISNLYTLNGRYFNSQKQYDSSRYYFEKSIELAEEDTLVLNLSDTYLRYANALKSQGDYEAALEALEHHNKYNSRIFEKEKLKEIEIANARFNIDEFKKNLEIAKREKKYQDQIIAKGKEKVVVMVLSSIVLVFILFFLNRVNGDKKKLIDKLKHKNKQYKHAKIQAEKLTLLKTKFFSTVSHEIRTPLYGVIGIASLLMEDISLKKHQTDLRSLKFSADYLLALINDVLQMNKMESNEVKLEDASFNLQDLINGILNSFEFTRIQNKNEINIEIGDKVPLFLIGDPVRLSQVLMNLVGNAMKFTERGTISLRTVLKDMDEDEAVIRFEVQDNGPGIPQSKKKIIFEEFSQLKSNNYNYQGTGLGLPIVKKLLLLFNSKIDLQSEEGVGSTFSFEIKFKIDKTASLAIPQKTSEPVIDPSTPGKILIVDDNRINQVVTKRILEKKNFECEVAGDGEKAVELVKSGNYDLVLMDVNMPGISGLEACMQIRKFNESIPVVALTAVEVDEIRQEIHAAGMNDIIVKPYDVQYFYQIIYKCITNKHHAAQA